MRRLSLLAGTAALSLMALSARAEAPKVVADIAPVQSLVARVMAGVGTPDQILPPGASPHGYSMKPSEARNLSQANLVVWIGEALTPWMEMPLDSLAGNARVIELMEAPGTTILPTRHAEDFALNGAALQDAAGHHHDADHDDHAHDDHDHDHDHDHEDHAGHDHDDHDHEAHDHGGHEHDAHAHEHEHEDHADHDHDDHDDHDHAGHDHDDHGHEGHNHGPTDPHAWLDPENAATWTTVIAEALSEIDPQNAETYAANAKAAQAELAELDARISAEIGDAGQLKFVTFHDAYQYFENRYGLTSSGTLSGVDATAPGAAHVAELRDRIAEQGITCVLTEPQFNSGLVESVFSEGEVTLGVIDPLGTGLESGAAFYPALLEGVASQFSACKK